MATSSVYVLGFTKKVTEPEIAELMAKAGKVNEVTLFKGGLEAMVKFETIIEALKAISKFNTSTYNGDTLVVSTVGQSGATSDISQDSNTGIDSQLQDIFAKLSVGKKVDFLKSLQLHNGEDHAQSQAAHSATNYVRVDMPRLSTFSGDKKEVKYIQWRKELECMEGDSGLSRSSIWQAVHRSVKGMAAEIITNLPQSTTIAQLLSKFDIMFGNTQSLEQLLQEYYMSNQVPSECVVTWGCRLEDMIALIGKCGNFTSDVTEEMLRGKFWSGLQSEYIKTALRHKFDAGDSMEDLLLKARVVEREQSDKCKPAKPQSSVTTSKQQSCQQSTVNDISSKLDELLKQMRALDGRVQKIERQNSVKDQGKSNNVNKSGKERPGDENSAGRGHSANKAEYRPERDSSSANRPWGDRSRVGASGDRSGDRTNRNPHKRFCYCCGDPEHLSYDCPLN
jgi:hypothetical protein